MKGIADLGSELVKVAEALRKGEISINDVMAAFGNNAKDSFVGDLIYVIENYKKFENLSGLPEQDIKDLAGRAVKAYEEAVTIGFTIYGITKSLSQVTKKSNIPKTNKVSQNPNTNTKGAAQYGDDIVEGAGSNKIPWNSWDNYEKVTANGQQYAKVGDRLYSKHAVERMQPSGKRYTVGDAIKQAGGVEGRSVSPQFVEDVISSVKPTIQANGNLSYVSGSMEIITNQQGYVVTIMTK